MKKYYIYDNYGFVISGDLKELKDYFILDLSWIPEKDKKQFKRAFQENKKLKKAKNINELIKTLNKYNDNQYTNR